MARPYALGALQSCSAAGNIIAALIGIGLGELQQAHVIESAWRVMFIIGALPALLVVVIMRRLKEPERWQQRQGRGHEKLGSMAELFEDPRWRRNALVGFALAFAGVVGLWGIGYFSYDLLSCVLDKIFRAQGLSESMIAGKKTMWTGITSLVQNSGAFLGVYAFTYFTQRTCRRLRSRCVCDGDARDGVSVLEIESFSDVFWMPPLMGFFQLALYRGVCDLFSGVVSDAAADHGDFVLLQRRARSSGRGSRGVGIVDQPGLCGEAEPLRWRGLRCARCF